MDKNTRELQRWEGNNSVVGVGVSAVAINTSPREVMKGVTHFMT